MLLGYSEGIPKVLRRYTEGTPKLYDALGEAMGKLHTLILDSQHMHDQSNACGKNHFPFDVEVEWGATADGAVA